jgi:glucose/mannose-6-phosphate isomerase
VLCSSYSGNTEETLAAFEAAGATGAPRAVLTTGGALGDAARAAGVPVIGVPAGFQPRAAVAYMVVGSLECAASCGAAPSLRSEVEAASKLLQELAGEWGPDAAGDSEAKRLALSLRGTIPVMHGAELTAPVAMRWKTQVNENVLWPSFGSALPEANHNEICSWDAAAKLGPFSAVFLEGRDAHPQVARRFELTAQAAQAAGARVERVQARSGSPLEQLMSLVLLGDLATVYWAILEGEDPTPVEPIERLKRKLAG